MRRKSILLLMVIFFIVFALSVSTRSMTIGQKLETLKNGTRMINEDPEYSDRFVYTHSVQPAITRGRAPADMNEEEEVYDEDLLYEVLDYLEKMNEENPDVMVGERKQFLDQLLNEMGRIFSDVQKRGSSEEIKQQSYEELLDVLNTIIEDVLMPHDDQTRAISREPQQEEIIQTTGIVHVNGNANVRSGPSTSYNVIASLENGDQVQVLEKNGNWYYIRINNDKNGYIYKTLLKVQDDVIVPDYQEIDLNAIVSASIANVRRGPGTDYSVIATLRRGNQIKLIGETDKWYLIKFNGDKTGFIFNTLVYADDPDAETERGRISVSSANIRTGPSTRYARITSLRRGEIVTCLSKEGDWYRIKMADGRYGYCHENLIRIIENDTSEPDDSDDDSGAEVPMARVKVSAANVRTGPSTNYRIVVTLHRGDVVELLSTDSSWYKIRLSDNQEAYCYKTLLEVISEPDNNGDNNSSDDSAAPSDDKVEAYINVSGAHVRKGPSTNDGILTTLRRGEMVQILNDENDWSEVIIPDGRKGYIFSSLLTGVAANSANVSATQRRIAQKALGIVNESDVIYGIDCYNGYTSYGRLACAAVISAVLRNSDCGYRQQILYCPYMQNYLNELGWQTIRNKRYEPGDVVFWTKRSGDRARHVGIIVQRDVYGKWWTVDNSTSSLRVLKRPLLRSYYPIVLPVKRVNR